MNIKIIKFPSAFDYIPFVNTEMACALSPYIYIPKNDWGIMIRKGVTNQQFSVLLHEIVHIIRQEQKNPIVWLVCYIVDPQYRLTEELIAIYCQMKYLNSKGLEYDRGRKARHFASATYLWLLPYDEALIILDKLWIIVGSGS